MNAFASPLVIIAPFTFVCFTFCLFGWSSANDGIINVGIVGSHRCFVNALGPMIQCQKDFQVRLQEVTSTRFRHINVSRLDAGQTRTICCGLSAMTSCLKGAIVKHASCNYRQKAQLTSDVDSVVGRADFHLCRRFNYVDGSYKCGFPIWASLTLAIVGMLILVSCLLATRRFCSLRYTDHRHIVEVDFR